MVVTLGLFPLAVMLLLLFAAAWLADERRAPTAPAQAPQLAAAKPRREPR
jgi:hypothetical protein